MKEITNQKFKKEWETLLTIKKIIFDTDIGNINQMANLIINKFDENNPISFNMIVSHMVYLTFILGMNYFDIYLDLIREIEIFEENKKISPKILKVFINILFDNDTQESSYLLEKMVEQNLIESNIIKSKKKPYFVHYMSDEEIKIMQNPDIAWLQILGNIGELRKNDWELQKKYVKEGINPNKIAKIIRNDNIEKLQKISSQTSFNFNQIIKPSLYERCSFINEENVSLINYAAFFGSVKCFKYLLLNNSKLINTLKYAIAGGNLEIFHLCEQNHLSFKGAYEIAIKFHRNEIFHYLHENKILKINNIEELGKICVLYHNYEIFTFLIEEGMKINDSMINESAKIGNIFFIKYFLKKDLIPKNILLFCSESGNIELVKYVLEQEGKIDINAKNNSGYTPLIIASEKGHTDIVKILLEQNGININAKDDEGETALMKASNNGYIEIAKLLLKQNGIDINAGSELGWTPLFFASIYNHIEIVKLLLEQNGININAKDYGRSTALMYASQIDNTDIVKLLLEQKGIEINAKNNDGNTALIFASENGQIKIVKILLEQKKIDINVKNDEGETALGIATKNGYTEIVKLLKRKIINWL